MTVLRLGTRPSALAVAQSELVAQRLRAAGHAVELVTVSTSGDRSSAPIPTLGVVVFVSQLRDALVANEVDLAVHSYKDLPTAPDPRLVIAAIPPREDPRDALVARGGRVLGELPAGATVGTGRGGGQQDRADEKLCNHLKCSSPRNSVKVRLNAESCKRPVQR